MSFTDVCVVIGRVKDSHAGRNDSSANLPGRSELSD
jgi:hypothetical protein